MLVAVVYTLGFGAYLFTDDAAVTEADGAVTFASDMDDLIFADEQFEPSHDGELVLKKVKKNNAIGGGGKKKKKGAKELGAFGGFILGCLLIWFALPLVWMNERKNIKVWNVIVKGRAECCNDIDIDAPDANNEKKLVHARGIVTTSIPITDSVFALGHENACRLRRVVEVYQWVEESYEKESDGESETKYRHKKEWLQHKVD